MPPCHRLPSSSHPTVPVHFNPDRRSYRRAAVLTRLPYTLSSLPTPSPPTPFTSSTLDHRLDRSSLTLPQPTTYPHPRHHGYTPTPPHPRSLASIRRWRIPPARAWSGVAAGDAGMVPPGGHGGQVAERLALELFAAGGRVAARLPGHHPLESLVERLQLPRFVGAVARSTGRSRSACRSFHRPGVVVMVRCLLLVVGRFLCSGSAAAWTSACSPAMRSRPGRAGSRAKARASRSRPSTSRSRRSAPCPAVGQPDQRAPPVGRVALALEQPLVLQVADDLADDRLGPVQVRGRLADRQRPGHGQVLEHRPGRALELAAGSVAAVKGQVHRPEPLGEPLGPLLRRRSPDQGSACPMHRQSRWIPGPGFDGRGGTAGPTSGSMRVVRPVTRTGFLLLPDGARRMAGLSRTGCQASSAAPMRAASSSAHGLIGTAAPRSQGLRAATASRSSSGAASSRCLCSPPSSTRSGLTTLTRLARPRPRRPTRVLGGGADPRVGRRSRPSARRSPRRAAPCPGRERARPRRGTARRRSPR